MADVSIRGASSSLNFQSLDGTVPLTQFYNDGNHFYLDLKNALNNFYITDAGTIRFTFNDAGNFTATGNITATGNLNGTLGSEQVRNAIALGTSGSLGTYALLRKASVGGVEVGTNVSAANLRYAAANGSSAGIPAGTWKCMGRVLDETNSNDARTSLFLRVA